MNVARAKASRLVRDCCITACMLFTLFSCTKETYRGGDILDYGGEPVEVELSLRVSSVQVVGARLNENGTLASPMTRTAEEPDKLEKQVNDIWVFQFTADGAQVGAPRYYTVQTADDGVEPVALMLHACENSQIFVVANTNDASWGNGKEGLSLAQLSDQTLTFTSEEDVYGGDRNNLPMAALVKQSITAGQPGSLSVTLKSLVAKIQFTYELGTVVAGKMHVVSVELVNVPDRVRLGNAVEANTSVYPGDAAFKALEYAALEGDVKEGTTYTWYIPQNRQGVIENPDKDQTLKALLAPEHAFYIRMGVSSDMDGGNYEYLMYPGADVYSDFNVQNGHCYRVNVKINTDKTDDRVLATPSNCYVMKSGASLVFDPYDRREKSRGYDYLDYKTYVNKNDPAKTIKRVDVLWQTKYNGKLAIGDNTSKNLVYLDENDLVHVTAGGEGNAVIAGYNASGTIVWSWHIWVNDDTPAQLSKAVTYTTYPWDNNQIYGYGNAAGKPRVAGFPFMSCNLGAMNNIPGKDAGADACGLFYQWGRKDPFPQKRTIDTQDFLHYTYANGIEKVYDAAGTLIALGDPTTGISTSGLFNSVVTSAQVGTIEYTIQHPTTFIAGAKKLGIWTSWAPVGTNQIVNYVQADGNWYWTPNDGGSYDKNDRFWGGEPFDKADKIFSIGGKQLVADNGAKPENKSIFDPCPAGWILPAADAWMGFTMDGLMHGANIGTGETVQESQDKFNATWYLIPTTCSDGSITSAVYSFYLKDWRRGETLHFPASGMRIPDGGFARVGHCGAYFTSAASPGGAAFILHFHSGDVIPYDNLQVYFRFNRRSNGCAIRCVRTSK